jgi:glutathione S-transferase
MYVFPVERAHVNPKLRTTPQALTVVDLFFIHYAALVTAGGSNIVTSKPNVARWYKEITALPSWLVNVDGVKSTAAY